MIKKNKKGSDFFAPYMEILILGAIVLGLLIRIFLPSLPLKIVITVLASFIVGRAMYSRKRGTAIAYVVVIAFLLGFLFGNGAFEILLLLVIFIAGYKIAVWAQKAGYVK